MSQDPRISELQSSIKTKVKDFYRPCMGLLLVFWIIFILAMIGHYGGLY